MMAELAGSFTLKLHAHSQQLLFTFCLPTIRNYVQCSASKSLLFQNYARIISAGLGIRESTTVVAVIRLNNCNRRSCTRGKGGQVITWITVCRGGQHSYHEGCDQPPKVGTFITVLSNVSHSLDMVVGTYFLFCEEMCGPLTLNRYKNFLRFYVCVRFVSDWCWNVLVLNPALLCDYVREGNQQAARNLLTMFGWVEFVHLRLLSFGKYGHWRFIFLLSKLFAEISCLHWLL